VLLLLSCMHFDIKPHNQLQAWCEAELLHVMQWLMRMKLRTLHLCKHCYCCCCCCRSRWALTFGAPSTSRSCCCR
jgi:hypothetical protein